MSLTNTFKWSDCFIENRIHDQLVFLKKYEINPNKYIYSIDDEFDLLKVTREQLQETYPNATIITCLRRSPKITSCAEDDISKSTNLNCSNNLNFIPISLNGEQSGDYIKIYDDYAIYSIDENSIILWYYDQNPEELIHKLLKLLPIEEYIEEEAGVNLVAYNQEYYTIPTKVQPTRINLEENYNDDFIPVTKDIEKFLDERKSGLIVLRGIVGSGKSNYIRHLVTTHPANYVIVTNSLAGHLASPEFISFMLENKNSIFILEDCEQILMDRGDNISGAIANILNMSDGLMSDIFNVKFICTFNADIDQIDKAILRKGRCFANYEFKKLCAEKTKVLLNKQGVTLDEYEPMTLAEIYNYQDNDCSNKKHSKIGF
jgi:hypothetical protein